MFYFGLAFKKFLGRMLIAQHPLNKIFFSPSKLLIQGTSYHSKIGTFILNWTWWPGFVWGAKEEHAHLPDSCPGQIMLNIMLNILGLQTKAFIAELIQSRWIQWSKPITGLNNYSKWIQTTIILIHCKSKWFQIIKQKLKINLRKPRLVHCPARPEKNSPEGGAGVTTRLTESWLRAIPSYVHMSTL